MGSWYVVYTNGDTHCCDHSCDKDILDAMNPQCTYRVCSAGTVVMKRQKCVIKIDIGDIVRYL